MRASIVHAFALLSLCLSTVPEASAQGPWTARQADEEARAAVTAATGVTDIAAPTSVEAGLVYTDGGAPLDPVTGISAAWFLRYAWGPPGSDGQRPCAIVTLTQGTPASVHVPEYDCYPRHDWELDPLPPTWADSDVLLSRARARQIDAWSGQIFLETYPDAQVSLGYSGIDNSQEGSAVVTFYSPACLVILTYDLTTSGNGLWGYGIPGGQPGFCAETASEDGPATASVGLGAAWPNPARGPVSVPFHLAEAREVRIEVIDATGRLVAVLFDGLAASGERQVMWTPDVAPAGLYMIRLTSNGVRETAVVTVVP